MKFNKKTNDLFRLCLLSTSFSFATVVTSSSTFSGSNFNEVNCNEIKSDALLEEKKETTLEHSLMNENDNSCSLPPIVRNYRIAYVADGNSPDPDDIGATAASIALMRAAGLEDKLVFCAHSCDLDPFRNPGRQVINATQEANRQIILQETCDGTASRWGGFDNLTFYNCRTQETTAINKLTEAINASTSTDRLAIILAGEPDVIYDAISAANSTKRQYVSIVSHHVANEESADTPGKNISNVRVDFPTVEVTRISDQNEELQTPFNAWDWARDHQDSRINWLWEQGKIAEEDTVVGFQNGKFDISDAGMLYYQIFDKDKPTVDDFRNIFECFVDGQNDSQTNSAPQVTITSPQDGAIFEVGTSIALEAIASDSDGNINKVNFKLNDRFYKQDSRQPYQNSFTPTQPGTYKIAARAFDNEGLATEVFVNIIVETAAPSNSAPQVTITSPQQGAIFTIGETIELKASAIDPDGNLDKVNFKLNDRYYRTDRVRPFENSFTPTEPGTYKIAARAFDKEGLSREVSITVTVQSNRASKERNTGTLSEEDGLNSIKIYPVPATKILNISGILSENTKVSVSDITGKIVLENTIQKSNPVLPIDNLESGFYIINIYENFGQKTISFIKR